MKILYFSRLRVAVGTGEEEVRPPSDVATVAALVAWLCGRSARHRQAFRNLKTIRVAVDLRHVAFDHPIAGAREIAFFPPVTGG